MNTILTILSSLFILLLIHLTIMFIFTFYINPHESSIFTRFFPYQFIFNLLFSKNKTHHTYFSIRVDINTSKKNVKKHNPGVKKLIQIANKHHIPITFSIATTYLPVLSQEVIELIKNGKHEIISHAHHHKDITQRNQYQEIKKSKKMLEKKFNQQIQGMVAPQGKHNLQTLTAAKKTNIKYISAGALSHIRYWSFPYPFQKKKIWLIGGSIPSDHYLFNKKNIPPEKALNIWKKTLQHRAEQKWFSQLEYHNFSTTEKRLKQLEKLFIFIKQNPKITPITQAEFIKKIEE